VPAYSGYPTLPNPIYSAARTRGVRRPEAVEVRDERAPVQAHRGRLAVRARAALREVALRLARQPPARVHAQLALDPALQPLAGAPVRRPGRVSLRLCGAGPPAPARVLSACAPVERAGSARHVALAACARMAPAHACCEGRGPLPAARRAHSSTSGHGRAGRWPGDQALCKRARGRAGRRRAHRGAARLFRPTGGTTPRLRSTCAAPRCHLPSAVLPHTRGQGAGFWQCSTCTAPHCAALSHLSGQPHERGRLRGRLPALPRQAAGGDAAQAGYARTVRMHAARRLLLPAHTAWAPAADAPAAEQGWQAAPAGGCQPTGGWLWAPRPLGERARRAWRTRLDAALEPCTSLLGGMWSPTTLPARLPQ
jgi:hypothetical protein